MAREKLVLAIGSLSTSTPSQSKIASTRSVRLVARHGDAITAARVRPVVPHGAVLNTAIVPEGDRVRAPAEAALEQRTLHVLVEIVQDGVAFVAWHANQRTGESAIEIQCLLARHRMRANYWMLGARILGFVGDAIVGIEATIDLLAVVDGAHALEILLHAL